MILKKKMELRIGIPKILKLYHPLAHDLFMKYLHLTRVVELIESGQAEKALIDICEVFKPMRAMLSSKFNDELNKDFMESCELYAETKMDGERFQLHMKDGVFRYFSRNIHEYSEGYNEFITPLIKFKAVVHSVILDGEMLVYDKINQRYHSKGETAIDVKHMKADSKLRPCFCAFDVLLLNDQSFLDRPYSERHQVLGQLFDDREGVLVKTKPIKVRDTEHIANLFNIAMRNEEEGIILKEANSTYKPGDRTGGWYKVKPDYFDGKVVTDFDCVIIGGFYRNPHKKDYIQRYMVGVVEKKEDGNFNVYACAEVVHGVKFQERLKLHSSLKPNLVEHAGETEIAFGRGKIFFGKNKPDAWIAPDKSIVLECRVSVLAKSSDQYTDYTFRFPRIQHVRRDKIWDESCTLKEFEEMYQHNNDGKVQNVVKRNVKGSDIISPSRKRKAPTSRKEIISKFTHNSQDSEEVVAVDNIFEGKEFAVLTTAERFPSIKTMQTIIKKHGGVIVEYPREGKTFAIIVGLMTKYVKNFMDKKVFNVIRAEWLVKHFDGEKANQVFKEMPKIRPVIDLIFTTEALKKSLIDVFDEFGDSYSDQYENVDHLKAILSSMKEIRASDGNIMELELMMGSKNFFRNISGAFVSFNPNNFLLKSAKSIFLFRAGRILELTDEALKVVLIDEQEIDAMKEQLEKLPARAKLVNFRWILDSDDAGCKLNMEKYLIEKT